MNGEGWEEAVILGFWYGNTSDTTIYAHGEPIGPSERYVAVYLLDPTRTLDALEATHAGEVQRVQSECAAGIYYVSVSTSLPRWSSRMPKAAQEGLAVNEEVSAEAISARSVQSGSLITSRSVQGELREMFFAMTRAARDVVNFHDSPPVLTWPRCYLAFGLVPNTRFVDRVYYVDPHHIVIDTWNTQ